jgi:hypothetical protein
MQIEKFMLVFLGSYAEFFISLFPLRHN